MPAYTVCIYYNLKHRFIYWNKHRKHKILQYMFSIAHTGMYFIAQDVFYSTYRVENV